MNSGPDPSALAPPALPAAPATPTPGPGAPGNALPPRIAHLFRRSLAQGRLHPLMPLLVNYRQSQLGRGTP